MYSFMFMRRPGGKLALFLSVLTTGCILGSCSADSARTSAPITRIAPPVVDSLPNYSDDVVPALPLDPYFLSPDDSDKLLKALDILVRDCVRRAGLAPPREHPSKNFYPSRNNRRYGIMDSREADANGYRLVFPEARPDEVLTEEQIKALSGTKNGKPGPGGAPAEGCNASAARQVTGTSGYPSDFPVVQQINHESFRISKEDGRVTKVIELWSECMKGKGFSYKTPFDTEFRQDQPPSPLEIETAKADVGCKRQVNFVNTWSGIESAYQKVLIDRNKKALDNVLLKRNEQLQKAHLILESR
ncbi:hypothetical protein [Embleya hyalina]|nr:hypothetical protein [Embleya hyalina]